MKKNNYPTPNRWIPLTAPPTSLKNTRVYIPWGVACVNQVIRRKK